MRERMVFGIVGLALLMQACTSVHHEPEAFHIKQSVLHHPPEGIQGELEWSGDVDLGHGVVEPAIVEVTSKGNGGMTICGQSFRVYDAHNDGEVFEPYMANITFVDVDGDGYRDLVIYVGRRKTEGEEKGVVRPYLRLLRYRSQSGRFEPFLPEEGADPS
jgi:hypothetical protein